MVVVERNANHDSGPTRSNTVNLPLTEEVEKLESALRMVNGHLKMLNMETSSGVSVF